MIKKALLFTLLLVMLTSAILADSDARPADANEKQFFIDTIAACESAVASIKTTWEQTNKSGSEVIDYLPVGSDNAPLSHHFYVEWANQPEIDKANAATSEALAGKVTEVQANSETPELKQLEELAEKVAAAATAGNLAEVEKLNKQIEEISAKQEAAFSVTDKSIKDIIERLAPRDAEIVVRIGINQRYQSLDAEPTSGKLADGNTYYRLENGRMFNENWVEGTSYVFLGKDWQQKKEEGNIAMEKAADQDKSYVDIQSVVIAVEAEQKRATEILNSMNLKALQTLIK